MKSRHGWPLALALVLVAFAAEAQERSVRGVVVDAADGVPIGAAAVQVKGTSVQTTTGADGTFTLEQVPASDVVLQVTVQDFKTEEVVVGATQRNVRVALKLEYAGAEEMVVVGRATESDRKHVANSVEVVSSEELTRAPPQSVDQALQGKVAGANIQTNSGAPGGGAQVKMRGISSINGSIEPLYVVDGMIVSNVSIGSGMSAVTASGRGSARDNQDDPVNRIADLNPNDIENVTVLKGSSAAAIYGSKAANGVIVITTKRGKEGPMRFNLTQRMGMYTLANSLGSRTFETVEEAVETFGESARQYYEPGRTFDHERALAGRRDLSTETTMSVSGTESGLRYFASALVKNDEGIIANTGYEKQSLRLNLSRDIGERLELRLNTNLVHSLAQRGLANNDNRGNSFYMVLSSTPSFFDLGQRPDGTWPENPFINSLANPLQTAVMMQNDEDVWRFLGSADAVLKVWTQGDHDVKALASVGVDRFQQKNELFFPPEITFEPKDDGLAGTSLFGTHENLNLNLSLNAVHTYRPRSGDVTATTSAGFQHEQRSLDSLYVVSRNLNAGRQNVDSGTQVGVTQTREKVTDRGFYLQEEVLLLEERMSLTGALRAEQSSANGDPSEFFFYPKAAAAYRLLGLRDWLDEVKLRSAYGETGNQPLYGMRFTPLAVNRNIAGNAGAGVAGTTGAADIHPERQREVEVGFDAHLFGSRARLDVTAYKRWISELLLRRALPPSSGFTTQFFNGGNMTSQGVEIGAQFTPVRTPDFQWNARVGFSKNTTLVTDLPVPAFNAGGFGAGLGLFRIEKGQSATQIVGNDGLRPDGTCCEVRKIGDTEPDFRMSLTNTLTYKSFNLGFLLDGQKGSNVLNLTKFLYDLNGVTEDYETEGVKRLEQSATSARAYLEDASFLKLREVSLSYDIPAATVRQVWGAIQSARVGVSGRNLLTFTPYTGLDPEVSNFGNRSTFRNIDVAPFPPSRSFWASIDLGF